MSSGQSPATQSAAPARGLSGTLAKTPMPRLLVSAANARVTGTLELTCAESGEAATLSFVRGLVTKVRTSAPVAYLGSILYEQGIIDDAEMNESLRELARTKWLHGEILLTRAAVDPTQLAEGLAEQTTRKLVHLFSFPATTTYTFDADVDRLANWGGADCPHVDPIAAVWRGIRDGFASDDVEAAMAKVETSAFRLATGASTRKYDLSDIEDRAVDCLRARMLTLGELVDAAPIDPRRARALVYFLCITKLAEPIETSGTRPAYRPPGASAPPSPSKAPAATMRPTVPEMSAVVERATLRVETPGRAIGLSESARWRAVGAPQSSMKVPVASRAASSNPPSPARLTMGGVAPAESMPRFRSAAPAASNAPTAVPPPRLSSPAPPRLSSPAPRASLTPTRPSMSPVTTLSPARLAELDARKLSIHERARAILKEDFFQRLSLTRDATNDQLDAAYEALRTLWDPALLPPALDEARDDCAFVMSCLGEAHATLSEPTAREEYVARLGSSALRALADQYGDDLAASGAASALEGAYVCFGRGELDRAERLCRRALKQKSDSASALALLAWLEATKPVNTTPDATRMRIALLDRAVRLDNELESAWYWRAQLHKRLENHQAALRDFRRVVELNPKNVDAVREIRVYEMRIRKNSITMRGVR